MAHENRSKHQSKAEEQYLEELVKRYGEEEARRILDMEATETVSDFHSPPARGKPTTAASGTPDAQRKPPTPGRLQVEGGDAHRHAVEHEKVAQEGGRRGQRERRKASRRKHAEHGERTGS
jgi:hypothetical protein